MMTQKKLNRFPTPFQMHGEPRVVANFTVLKRSGAGNLFKSLWYKKKHISGRSYKKIQTWLLIMEAIK